MNTVLTVIENTIRISFNVFVGTCVAYYTYQWLIS